MQTWFNRVAISTSCRLKPKLPYMQPHRQLARYVRAVLRYQHTPTPGFHQMNCFEQTHCLLFHQESDHNTHTAIDLRTTPTLLSKCASGCMSPPLRNEPARGRRDASLLLRGRPEPQASGAQVTDSSSHHPPQSLQVNNESQFQRSPQSVRITAATRLHN